MVPVAQFREDGNRFRKFAHANVAKGQIEFGGVVIGNMAARGKKMGNRF